MFPTLKSSQAGLYFFLEHCHVKLMVKAKHMAFTIALYKVGIRYYKLALMHNVMCSSYYI